MEVDFAFLADAAEAVNGKLYVVGGAIDTIWSTGVPVVYPRLSFAMRLLITPAELGRKHNLEINIMDEDGKRMITVGGTLDAQRSPELPAGWKQGTLIVLHFGGQFPKFGNYTIEIVVNNSSIKSVPLRVAQRVQL